MNKERRGFMAWLAGFFGLGAVTQLGAQPVSMTNNHPVYGKQGEWILYKQDVPNKKGIIVFTMNVGNLPPLKAEAYIERIKDQFRKSGNPQDWQDWQHIFMPVRHQETKVEIFSFEKCDYIEPMKVLGAVVPFVAPSKESVKDYVLLMLGAPVVKVELDDTQLEFAYNSTKEAFAHVSEAKGSVLMKFEGSRPWAGLGDEIFKQMVYARAMIMLGHIRGKYISLPGSGGNIVMDGETLREEGNTLLAECMEELSNL
jgi:hypothetical protein